MRALLIALTVFACLGAGTAFAQQEKQIDITNVKSWCRTEKAPRLDIKPATARIKYDHTKTKSQLNGFEVDTVNPYGTKVHTDVGGLMKGGIETGYDITMGSIRTSDNRSCAWYDSITVDINITPTIFIARDYKKGSCMYNAVLEHENKHIAVDRKLVNTYAQQISKALQAELARQTVYGPVATAEEKALQDQMYARIAGIMKKQMAILNTERLKRQQQVDSLEEYNRVNALCPNERH